jgi:hypothetical protein
MENEVFKVSNISESSLTTTPSTTCAVLHNLNFESGVAGDFTLNILQHLVKKESLCNNLHNRYEDGHSLHEKLTDARQFAGGAQFKVHHIALNEEVLASMREAKEQERVDESDHQEVVKNIMEEFKK